MAEHKTVIPWAGETAWAQVELSISRTIAAMGPKAAPIRTLAKQIVQGYADIEEDLERLCLQSCLMCSEVCCTRATVWYDLKDLLVIYLNTGTLPNRQIYRRSDNCCCNLTHSGCRLKRSERPFICTWYICAAQKKVLERCADSTEGVVILGTIGTLKTARTMLEETYINISCT